LTDSFTSNPSITKRRIPDTINVLMIIDKINAGSKLKEVFKYSKNDVTMSILLFHRDIKR
jgi:hypothetical protein